jgi:hypothetical protein
MAGEKSIFLENGLGQNLLLDWGSGWAGIWPVRAVEGRRKIYLFRKWTGAKFILRLGDWLGWCMAGYGR